MKRILLVVVVLLATACTPEQLEWWGTTTAEEQAPVTKQIIIDAAHEYGVDPNLMLSISKCESGLRWWAKNKSGASGLFQHMPQYWQGRAEAIGQPDADILDPVANARAAAMMLQAGASPWNPSRHCWG